MKGKSDMNKKAIFPLLFFLFFAFFTSCSEPTGEKVVLVQKAEGSFLTQTESTALPESSAEQILIPLSTSEPDNGVSKSLSEEKEYVLNLNTKKFHLPTCSSVKDIKTQNKLVLTAGREEIISDGYQPCKNCNP